VYELDGSFRYLGGGGKVAVEVSGSTFARCLARAVEGFMGAFADVHPAVQGRPTPVHLAAGDPGAQLHALLAAAVDLSTDDGIVAFVHDVTGTAGGELDVTVEVVPRSCGVLAPPAPWLVTFHDVRLVEQRGRWRGCVVATLGH
jgi:hypothetical protein